MESFRPEHSPGQVEWSNSVSLTLPPRQRDLDILLPSTSPLGESRGGNVRFRLLHDKRSLWVVAQGKDESGFAFCIAPDGGEETRLIDRQTTDEGVLRVRIHTEAGEYTAVVELPTTRDGVLHWQTTFRPAADLRVPAWSRDILPFAANGRITDSAGIVHARQKAITGNVLYVSLTKPTEDDGLTLLYAQNLGALTAYFERTKQSASGRIGGDWPELGFEIPPAADVPLHRGEDYVISDAYVRLTDEVPTDDASGAELFLRLYADIYQRFPKPEYAHRDWPRRVRESVRDLSHSPMCGEDIKGNRYIFAYAGTNDRPPESMVQLAVLVPLTEYAQVRKLQIPLADAIKRNLETFRDKRAGCVARWLPLAHDRLQEQEEHMKPEVMDAWYLLHTCMNLGRMARFGDATAKELFLESVEFNVRVAQRVGYQWPVFYDLYTLDIIKSETRPGAGGEHDVGALYARVMLDAYDMTKQKRFLDEAVHAARALTGLGFDLAYQYNNVAFGAGAFYRLWKLTGDEQFKGLSTLCWANVIRNLWLWDCCYGNGKHYTTFMGLAPLQDAEYLALYEELEVLAAIHEYLHVAGDDVLPALRVLLPEYCRWLVHRAWYHYPSELPTDVLAPKPASGELHRYLSVPVEDLREGWQPAGQVGQEVYGAAAPFIIATRHCHQLPKLPFVLHCNYPAEIEWKQTPLGGTAHLKLRGDRRCRANVRIAAEDYAPLPSFKVRLHGTAPRYVDGQLHALGFIEYVVPGDADLMVTWGNDRTFIGSTPVLRAVSQSSTRRRTSKASARAEKKKTGAK